MIIVLTGPTGVGKSELAISLAKKVNGEIVNADAFQVYQGLHIATAAPTSLQLASVPSHLYGFVPLEQSYDICAYQKDARNVIEDILSRNKTPILVGGSGLYIRSALYDYDLNLDTSSVDMSPYKSLNDEKLHKVLEKLDPEEAKKIHPHNRKRVERDVEICLALHGSKTSFLAKQSHQPIYPKTIFVALIKERQELYPSLDQRVDKMFEAGLLDETLPLIKKYGRDTRAFQAIGVKELFGYIDGTTSLDETKDLIKKNTRHYVKRQETFFAHQFPINYVETLDDILKLCQ
jgi:tRNA dimethylallyltransferase